MRLSKEIFLHSFNTVSKESGMSKSQLNMAISTEGHPYNMLIESQLSEMHKLSQLLDEDLLMRNDITYYYKRMKQYVIDSIDTFSMDDTVDLTCLRNIKTGIVIDTVYEGRSYAIFVWVKDSPDFINGKMFSYSVNVFDSTTLSNRQSFLLSDEEMLRKIFVFSENGCRLCKKCKAFDRVRLLSRRRYDECPMANAMGVDYFTVAKCIEQVLRTEQMMLKKRRTHKEKVHCDKVAPKIHVAKWDSNNDKLLTLKDSTYQYKESHPSEYRGGHHASPCAHTRRGYFRKSRIGDHIIKDGEFVKVAKGTGTHTWVDSHPVNFASDAVGFYKL